MKRFRVFVIVTALLKMLSADAFATERLNVLFIAVDDLRPELGCYGVPVVKSPNIDKLAAMGTLFTRAYCQQAVCNPSRASLMTGLRPESTGVLDLPTHFRARKPDAITIAQHFKANGYFAQRFGKIFHVGHGNYDDKFSWSEPGPELKTDEYRTCGIKRTKAPGSKKGAVFKGPPTAAPDVEDSALPDGEIADQAIAALQKHRNEPFFLAVGFHKPHLPFIAPKKYWDFYKETEIPPAPNPFHPRNTPIWTGNNSGELRGYQGMPATGAIDSATARKLKHGYFAAVSFMDAQVGRVLAELDHLNLRTNTVVIFWGDHGWHLGDQDMWCKHTDYEVATHSPLLISIPGQKKRNVKCNALVEFVDVFPSLVEICGLPMPNELEGTSFKPLIDEPTRPWKTAAFSVWPKRIPDQGDGMGWAIRTDRYRYVEWSVPGKKPALVELYDHQSDCNETENLAAKPEHAALIKKLSAQLKAGWKAAKPAYAEKK